jgi:hypothetical protein
MFRKTFLCASVLPLLAFGLLSIHPALAQDIALAPWLNYPLETDSAWKMVSCDFNNDSRLDIVAFLRANDIQSSFAYILLGFGDGTFRAPIPFEVFEFPVQRCAVTTGDFNNDGNLDLAIMGVWADDFYRHDVRVLLGDGTGAFPSRRVYSITSYPPSDLQAHDFDNDGYLDLALAYDVASDHAMRILLGNGDGTFQEPSNIPMMSHWAITVCFDDFNLDGILDVAVGMDVPYSDALLQTYLGQGDGTFAFKGDLTLSIFPDSIASDDLNGDGVPDLAMAVSYADKIITVFGQGDGTFVISQVFSSVYCNPLLIHTADFNKDGFEDIIVTSSGCSERLVVWKGTGDGIFEDYSDSEPDQPFSYQFGDMSVRDFNEDGRVDVAIADTATSGGYGGLSIVLNASSVGQEDIDGDGVSDTSDNCPTAYNPDQVDWDGDGAGDACDACPWDREKTEPGACGCAVPDTDSDRDGIADCVDACAFDALNDADDDGICGNLDACPGTVIPEPVPTVTLRVNRYAVLGTQINGIYVFDTVASAGNGPQPGFTLKNTDGCTCAQILAQTVGDKSNQYRYGCSASVIEGWIAGLPPL